MPMSDSLIDPAVLQAYRETEYRVYGDAPCVLKIAEVCPAIALLHLAHAVNCSAFISACNPHGNLLGDAENAQRHAALGHELAQGGYAFIAAEGADPSGSWPAEASYLILGMQQQAARALGMHLEQNAVVWIGADAWVQLILLR